MAPFFRETFHLIIRITPDVRFSSVKTSSCSFLRICQSRSVFASVAIRDRPVESKTFHFSPFRKTVKRALWMIKLTHKYSKLWIIYARRNLMKYFLRLTLSISFYKRICDSVISTFNTYEKGVLTNLL